MTIEDTSDRTSNRPEITIKLASTSDELLPAVVDTFKRIAPMIDYLCAALELEF